MSEGPLVGQVSATAGRRSLVLGGTAGLGLGALGLWSAAPASALVEPGPRKVGLTASGPRGVLVKPHDTRRELTAALDRYMAGRVGVAGLSVRDNRNGRYYAWRPRSGQTHSAIKVLILIATLKVAQDRGRDLTATQKSQCSRMIRYSDNDATDALMVAVGAPYCQRVANALGMTSTKVLGGTVFRSDTWWGHSTSTTRDLLVLEDSLVYTSYLSTSRRIYARGLMASVTSTQTWGLGDGLPSDVHVELKNGWGPRSDGYRLNGLGHVKGRGRSYQMAFLSTTHGGYSYGQTTVNRLSRIVFDELAVPLN